MAIDLSRAARICDCGEHAFSRLSRHGVALVSPSDYDILAERMWHHTTKGYADSRGGKLHRRVLSALPGELVDHINHDKLDCRRKNLRIADDASSVRNRKKLRRGNGPASQYIGVHRNGRKWIARITIDGVRKSLGNFDNDVEAAKAYDAEAKKNVGEFARLNFGGQNWL